MWGPKEHDRLRGRSTVQGRGRSEQLESRRCSVPSVPVRAAGSARRRIFRAASNRQRRRDEVFPRRGFSTATFDAGQAAAGHRVSGVHAARGDKANADDGANHRCDHPEHLSAEVAERRFQEDLFYRPGQNEDHCIPPLRDRLDDIPELVEFFIAKHSRTMGQRVTAATSETIRILMSAPWRGNVRQLDNAIERAVMMCDGTQLRPNDLPADCVRSGSTLAGH